MKDFMLSLSAQAQIDSSVSLVTTFTLAHDSSLKHDIETSDLIFYCAQSVRA